MHHVTQRPEAFVRETIVIALLFALREPHAPQGIAGIILRHAETAVRVAGLAIAIGTAVSHPHAAAGAHPRLDGRHDTTGRRLREDFASVPDVTQRLAIRDDEQRAPVEARAHELLEALLGPHGFSGQSQCGLTLR